MDASWGILHRWTVVAFNNSVRVALFALTSSILYHIFHVNSFPTHTFFCAEVASCACPGKPRAQASTRSPETKYQETASCQPRSNPLGRSISILERLAKTVGPCPTRDRHPLAQGRIPALLELEEPTEVDRKKSRSQRRSRSHPHYVSG